MEHENVNNTSTPKAEKPPFFKVVLIQRNMTEEM